MIAHSFAFLLGCRVVETTSQSSEKEVQKKYSTLDDLLALSRECRIDPYKQSLVVSRKGNPLPVHSQPPAWVLPYPSHQQDDWSKVVSTGPDRGSYERLANPNPPGKRQRAPWHYKTHTTCAPTATNRKKTIYGDKCHMSRPSMQPPTKRTPTFDDYKSDRCHRRGLYNSWLRG